jgi:glucosamine--fructose-6-phosphate aminotransferase (isomerizing)
MCGIVGYLGKGKAQEPLIDGLRRLEYRGYDSAGVAFHEGKEFSMSRETGRVKNLAKSVQDNSSTSSLGLLIQDGLRMALLPYPILILMLAMMADS